MNDWNEQDEPRILGPDGQPVNDLGMVNDPGTGDQPDPWLDALHAAWAARWALFYFAWVGLVWYDIGEFSWGAFVSASTVGLIATVASRIAVWIVGVPFRD